MLPCRVFFSLLHTTTLALAAVISLVRLPIILDSCSTVFALIIDFYHVYVLLFNSYSRKVIIAGHHGQGI
jgi:Na+/glutamate symporter